MGGLDAALPRNMPIRTMSALLVLACAIMAEQAFAAKLPKKIRDDKPIFTEANPGKWDGKEDTHVPIAKVIKTGSTEDTNSILEIEIPHKMNKDHWIDYLYAKNQDGKIIFHEKFGHDAREARLYHLLEPQDKEVTPYAHCNLHGTWSGDTMVKGKNGWATRAHTEL